MIGQLETQDEAKPEKVEVMHPIVTGFYAAVGGAIFAAAYTFIRAQFIEERRQ